MAGTAHNAYAEEWRDVVGYEGFYEVSSLGGVRALDRPIVVKQPRRAGGLPYRKVVKGRKLVPNISGSSGYYAISLSRGNQSRRHSLHVIVCAAFHGSRPTGFVVAHCDGNKHNNVAANLRYASYSDNAIDKEIHGNGIRGSRNGMARLTDDEVRSIKQMSLNISAKDVAAQFNVSVDCVRLIRLGDRWKHIQV